MADFIIYNPRYRVIVCQKCQLGVLHPGLATHLSNIHRYDLAVSVRKATVAQYSHAPLIISTSVTSQDLPQPQDPPIPHVQVYTDGYGCLRCPYVCRSVKGIKGHCKGAHQWGLYHTRGGNHRPGWSQDHRDPPIWQTGVSCQRLFNIGPLSSYYTITIPAPSSPQPLATPDDPQTERVRALIQRQSQRLQAEPTVTIQPGHTTEANPWLRITRWPELLDGLQLRRIAPLVDLPRPHEFVLQDWTAILDGVILQAQQSIVDERINVFDQTLVRMFTDHAVRGGLSLVTKLQGETYKRYKQVWMKLLGFLLRTCSDQVSSQPPKGWKTEMEAQLHAPSDAPFTLPTVNSSPTPASAQVLTAVAVAVPPAIGLAPRLVTKAAAKAATRPARQAASHLAPEVLTPSAPKPGAAWGFEFDLTPQQQYWVQQCFWLSTERIRNREQESSSSSEESTSRSQSLLQQALCRLCISLLDHVLRRRLRESIIVNFLAVLGIDRPNRTFYPPANYTPQLSALVTITQLLVIQESVYAEDYRRVISTTDHLQALRSRCLLKDSHTPFAWILELRAHGRKIRNNTTSEGYIVWNHNYTSLQFKQLVLNIDAFRGFAWRQLDLIREELYDLLLWDSASRDAVPSFNLASLQDNPANTTNGWSFLQHPPNRLGQWDGWLLNRIVHSPQLQDAFFWPASQAGDYLPKEPAWKADQGRQYLKLVQQFLTRLALLVLIFSGQPARGTELLSVRYQNTLVGGCRNLFLSHGVFSFATLYHKGYSLRGTTKRIYRYLPPELSHVLVQYLVLIRPFRDHLQQFVYSKAVDTVVEVQPPSSFLWSKEDGSPWDTQQLSQFLSSESSTILGANSKLNIANYRHIAIAISREFIPKGKYFERELGHEVLNTLDAQAAHTPITGENEYGRLSTQGSGEFRTDQERYCQVSQAWYNWFLEWKEKQPVAPAREAPLDFVGLQSVGKLFLARKNLDKGLT